MKIVVLSTFMNQHQLPLSLELFRSLGNDYKYIALNPISEGRKKLGQDELNDKYSFIVRFYESNEQMEYAKQLISECDVLLAGHCQDSFLYDRIRAGKLIIKTSERYFKEVPKGLNVIKQFVRAKRHLARFQNEKFYFLCASAYTAADVNKYTNFQNKTYKWGYFPECKKYDDMVSLIKKKQQNSILWVGRMLDWKHPEIPILVAFKLKSAGYSIKLNMIGSGEMEESLKQLIIKYQLSDCVSLLGARDSETVRTYMENSQIFMFTSDQEEGWGVVLNEAMNSGCAVVANDMIGSVPFLIKDYVNGLIYLENDIDDILHKVKYLLDNREKANEIGYRAYETITHEWSPALASERLLKFCEEIMTTGKCDLYTEGPCSRA